MKKLLCISFIVISSFSIASSQDTNSHDQFLMQLLNEFASTPANIESYIANGIILIQNSDKNITIKEYALKNVKFVIRELSEIEKNSAYLELRKLKIKEDSKEGEIIGNNGDNINISIKTVTDDNAVMKKSEKEELEAFTFVLDYLFLDNNADVNDKLNNIIQGKVIYIDLVQRIHCPDSIFYKDYLILFISPRSEDIEKCKNKYIQIINYGVNKATKSISVQYRLINGNKISMIHSKCGPCKEIF